LHDYRPGGLGLPEIRQPDDPRERLPCRKHLLVQSVAREKMLHGARALADAFRVTLGPKSKCVLIEKKWAGKYHEPAGGHR
jgi:hypothetical protein